MYIPDETIQLVIEQGTAVADGARIAPGSTFEVSGDVLFEKTNTRPDFDCPVSVDLMVQLIQLRSRWYMDCCCTAQKIQAKALTWSVDCIRPR